MASKDLVRKDRTDTAVVKVVPEFLTGFVENDQSLEGIVERRVVPRVKVIQQMSDTKLKQQHGEGSAVLPQAGLKIANAGESFLFVPIFFFPEWIKWGDRRDPNTQAIQERTFDPNSPVARRAQNADERYEDYGPSPKKNDRPLQFRYVEHLNFVGLLYGANDERLPVVISFSRGEHYAGRNFCTAISMRRVGKAIAPLWSQVWKMTVNLRERDGNKWFGIDVSNPDEGTSPWIREDEAAEFRQQWELFRDLHKQNLVEVDRTGEVEEEVATSGADM
ncbi:hypothetical protein [Caudoviricetes sp.]|nr:hypothetical protein [Caudoviricetes sp.]UOF82779.1 hypothetical protein [Caudoviricetes sp.]